MKSRDVLYVCGVCGILPLLAGVACSTPTPAAEAPQPPPAPVLHKSEHHLSNLRQLTYRGENAEAYWSFDGTELIYQAHEGPGCDQIYRMSAVASTPSPQRVSTGLGSTTCAYFLPGNEDILYASTHLGGEACPPKPDHSQGYVWPLYTSYDIFRAKADGSGLTRLTETPGYDAEGTVCAVDGSIIFTSVRDGDLELYRMDADGKNVKRLTNTPGYDGGAFFSADCKQIVWRASRPQGKDLADYQRLLAEGLVRPSQLELYVGDADGSNAHQVTYLNAAAFAPFFHPSGKRILFSTNFGDPKGREFDIWAVNTDGTHLERITHTPGFDGFPMFSPDGKKLAFASNRANAPGSHDTNVFVADWVEEPETVTMESAADRVQRDVAWLSDPAREGRGVGTAGLQAAGEYIEKQFQQIGLEPFRGSYRQELEVTTGVRVDAATSLSLAEKPLAATEFQPLAFSADGSAKGGLVLAGYGIVEPSLGIDDYKGVNAKGRIVVVRRFVPETEQLKDPALQRRLGDLRQKAWQAREHGAVALIVVDAPVPPASAPPTTGAAPPASGSGAHSASPSAGAAASGPGVPPASPAVPAATGVTLASTAPTAPASSAHSAPSALHHGPAAVQTPSEAVFPALHRDSYGDVGLPVLIVKRQAFAETLAKLEKKQWVNASLRVALALEKKPAFNVLGRLPAPCESETESVVVGAHYDHLGFGGQHSLAPEERTAHVGADDNASGVAALLEIARRLKAAGPHKHNIVFVAFTAEESGLLGSSHLVQNPVQDLVVKDIRAMLNLDMVGRLRNNQLNILGEQTADEWGPMLQIGCAEERLLCSSGGGGYGPSDQASFFSAGIPVLHFFTGSHVDYHKPTDTADKINAAGIAQVAKLVVDVAMDVDVLPQRLTFRNTAPAQAVGDTRSYNASLGSMPDYAGPPDGKGVLLAGVRPGGAAELAGMQRGDVLIRLGKNEIKSVHDLMFALNAHKPAETVTAIVLRNGKEVALKVTFQESQARR